MTEYERWLSVDLEDKALTEELLSIKDLPEEINDRFYRDLAFGTAGLRGVLGAGTNRMNIYTVRKATQGLSNYLNKHYACASVAIAHDSRHGSELFTKEAARVLAANGITAHLYSELMPTPSLSFAVRYLHCESGICVTASHNPAKYNGYKVYGSDGCQIGTEVAKEVLEEIGRLDLFSDIRLVSYEEGVRQGKIRMIPEEVTQAFLDSVKAQSLYEPADSDLQVVYTPLNGAGRRCVLSILSRVGIKNVTVVPEQEWPDGDFPTCPFPNPELREALTAGLALCEKTDPDLLLATDPDCDRCGIAVRHHGEYVLPTGNEIGILLFYFIASRRLELGILPENPVLITTIVSTDMVDAIAKTFGVEVARVYTGFKFIGDCVASFEEKGEEGRCIFSFEESNGYLAGTYVRDKDAVNSSMFVSEMAQYYKKQGKTLIDVLEELYQRYGYYLSGLANFVFEGEDGMKTMDSIMEKLRKAPPKTIAGYSVCGSSDYKTSVRLDSGKESRIPLPSSNVLEYRLENGAKLMVRPSGTEPKIKVYCSAKSPTRAGALAMIDRMKVDAAEFMKGGA